MDESDDVIRAALAGCRWGHAYTLLAERALVGDLSVDELGWIGTAAYMMGRDDESFSWWARGHHNCLEAGDAVRAARFGVQLSEGLGFKGDVARASGWVERVRRVLDAADADCVELGYLQHATGMCRIFEDGDIPKASDAFNRALKIAERFRDPELLALAQIGEGRCLIYLGRLHEGVSLLDEAMLSVEANEVSPVAVGDAYCTVIDAFHELFDIRRCEAWTESFTSWCDAQADLVLYRGHCLLHRAEILHLHGRWAEAVAFAQEACQRLAEPLNVFALGGAHYLEAELRRLRGEDGGAEHAYERAHRAGCEPQPGLSLLRLGQGRLREADASIRRVLAQADGPVARARVLGPFIEILLAVGDVDGARGAAQELTALGAEFGSALLQAQAAHFTGAALLGDGDATAALVPLRRAWKAWVELDVPHEEARARLLIASACEVLGDHEGALLERGAARAAFEHLGSKGDLQRVPSTGDQSVHQRSGGLSKRELEVLVLVARGSSNRAIARALFISEKTVTSHLSHIFTKLDVSSRSAATSYAYEHGLV